MSQLLQNALYGGVMILAVAALRRVLKDRLIPGARLALWAVCLFRLLTPAAPESVLSLWGLSRLFEAKKEAAPVGYAPQPVPAAGVPAPTAQPGPVISWETVLLAVWLAVGAALAVRYVLSWRRTRRAVACAIPLEREDGRYAALPKCARLREGPMEGAPLTFGVARPTVVLSPGLEGGPLECALAHEGVHAARRDNLWHYAMALTLVVHWWNPAVWLMARLLRRDVELSCDRAALKKLGEDRRAEYAQALVSLAVQGSGPAFCQTFGRKAAEERILSIMKFKKTSIIGVIFTLALVLAVTAAFASEPKEPKSTFEVNGVTLTGDAAKYARQLYIGMTQDEVYQLMGKPHGTLSGLYGDVYIVDKLGDPSIQPTADAPAFVIYYDGTSTNRVIHVRYRAEDGQAVDLIFDEDATTSSAPASRIFPYGEDSPAYMEEGELIADTENQLLGEGHIEYDEGTTDISNYTVDTESAGVIGQRFYSYEAVTDPDAVSGSVTGGEAVPVAPAASSEPVAAQPLVNPVPAVACGVAGCTETRNHVHANGCAVLVYDPCPVEGCAIPGNHTHNGVNYSCNGFHSGGHCDGNCPSYSTAYPSASSGHYDGHH